MVGDVDAILKRDKKAEYWSKKSAINMMFGQNRALECSCEFLMFVTVTLHSYNTQQKQKQIQIFSFSSNASTLNLDLNNFPRDGM